MIRKLAEEKAREKEALSPENLEALSPEEILRILHELRVHQIELEMQNEELRRSQSVLDAVRARYFALYDLAPVGYCTVSENGLILEANLIAATLLGVSRGALVKQPISRFILKEDQDVYYLYRNQLVETGAPHVCDLRMLRQDGTTFWTRLESTAVQDNNGAPMWSVVLNDITESKRTEEALRESEAQFRAIFEVAYFGIVQSDRMTGRILRCNEAYCRITGYPLSELLKVTLPELTHPEDRQQDWEIFSGAARGETPFYYNEKRYIRKDGSIIWVRLNAAFVRDSNGQAIRTVAVCEDITDRKRAEEQLKSSLAEKEVLLKEVHHRVKNNLQVISSLISLQADCMIDKQMTGILGDVRDRVKTMALVHEKLYQTENLAQIDFAEYASSLLKYLWSSHGAATGNVRLNMSVELLILPADQAVHCGLILNELATNALKHAFPGGSGGEVTVVIEHDPATGAVCLGVCDNGVGLPADLDWRQSSTLGLRLVQMLAGQMSATVQTGPGSDPGPGTDFQVNFKV